MTDPEGTNNGYFTWLCASIFIGAGLLAMSWCFTTIRAAPGMNDWPKVDGTIVSSSVVAHSGRGAFRYFPKVAYRYLVGKSSYIGTNILSYDFDLSEGTAEKLKAEYPPDALVAVYYDPSSPNRSVLKSGLNGIIYWYMSVAIASVLCGAVQIVDVKRLWARVARK